VGSSLLTEMGLLKGLPPKIDPFIEADILRVPPLSVDSRRQSIFYLTVNP
jgi:hypothetical protein